MPSVLLIIVTLIQGLSVSGDGAYKSSYICDGVLGKLRCPKKTVIKIHMAEYGREEGNRICPSSTFLTTKCRLKEDNILVDETRDVMEILDEKCSDRRSCKIKPSTRLFGDPCPQIYKYLSLVYSCEEGIAKRRERKKGRPKAEKQGTEAVQIPKLITFQPVNRDFDPTSCPPVELMTEANKQAPVLNLETRNRAGTVKYNVLLLTIASLVCILARHNFLLFNG